MPNGNREQKPTLHDRPCGPIGLGADLRHLGPPARRSGAVAMTTPAPPPRLATLPTSQPTTNDVIPWRAEVHVAIRDGLACRNCDLPLVADDDRQVVRVDPTGDTSRDNLALLCRRCAEAHRVHPQPLEPAHERFERLC